MKLIVGLGNPGLEYNWTRHNIGWHIIDSYVENFSLGKPQMKFRGYFWGPTLIKGQKVSFLKPKTYMNLSGESVLQATTYMNLSVKNILIVYDDVALPWGKIRLKNNGTAGGQKGMASILNVLKTTDVPRLRIGIGSPTEEVALDDWVLGKIPPEQRRIFDLLKDISLKALNLWLFNSIDIAMSKINGSNFISDEV